MADVEDNEKAEKLAAAKKRYEQLKKQKKSKEEKAETTSKKTKKKEKAEDEASKTEAKDETPAAAEEEHVADDGDAAAEAEDKPVEETAETGAEADTTQNLKSPPLPSTGDEGDAVQDIYKRQRERIIALEEENKRLQKEAQTRAKLEEELEDLRDKQAEASKAGGSSEEVTRLEAENSSLRRQLNTTPAKRRPSTSHTGGSEDVVFQLNSKQSTIEALELDLSNLRHTSFQNESKISELESRISTLTADLETSKSENSSLSTPLITLQETTSSSKPTETDTKDTEATLTETRTSLTTAQTQISTLQKKIETLQTLHRDSETRNAQQNTLRLKEMDRIRTEASDMRRRLQERSFENARLRSLSVSSAGADGDATGSPGKSMEDALKRKIRELESEVVSLRSGSPHRLANRRQSSSYQGPGAGIGSFASALTYNPLQGQNGQDPNIDAVFDEVDLSTPSVAEARARRASPYGAFSNILSTFTGAGTGSNMRRPSGLSVGSPGREKKVGFLSTEPSEKGGGFFDSLVGSTSQDADTDVDGAHDEQEEGESEFGFDEEEFRRAQEEEQRQRLERVREVKRSLPQWRGYRLDLVDMRGGERGGVFEV